MHTAHEKEVVKNKQKKRMSLFREQEDKVKAFRKLCLKGPTFVCASCKRLVYEHMVTKITDNMYENSNKELLQLCLQIT